MVAYRAAGAVENLKQDYARTDTKRIFYFL